jgi:hypothetical protein
MVTLQPSPPPQMQWLQTAWVVEGLRAQGRCCLVSEVNNWVGSWGRRGSPLVGLAGNCC